MSFYSRIGLKRVINCFGTYTLMAGTPSIWASAEGNRIVINVTSFRGLMLAEEKNTETIIGRVSEAMKRLG